MKILNIIKRGLKVWWNCSPAEICERLNKILPTSQKEKYDNIIIKRGLMVLWRYSPAEICRRQKRYNNIKKINLCGGPVSIDGYIKIDKSSNADIVHNLLKPLPIESDSVQIIVMSHALNYFTYEEAKFVVSEIYRVLRKDGIVRVSFPDLRIFAKAYVENDISFLFQKLPNGEDRFTGRTIGDKFIGLAYFYCGQKYFFDFESAAEIFKDVGFKQIVRCGYRESEIPEIDKIDNRPELSGYLEAVK